RQTVDERVSSGVLFDERRLMFPECGIEPTPWTGGRWTASDPNTHRLALRWTSLSLAEGFEKPHDRLVGGHRAEPGGRLRGSTAGRARDGRRGLSDGIARWKTGGAPTARSVATPGHALQYRWPNSDLQRDLRNRRLPVR